MTLGRPESRLRTDRAGCLVMQPRGRQPYRVGGRSGDAGSRSVVSGAKQTAPRLNCYSALVARHGSASARIPVPRQPRALTPRFYPLDCCWSPCRLLVNSIAPYPRVGIGGEGTSSHANLQRSRHPGTLGPPQIRKFPIPSALVGVGCLFILSTECPFPFRIFSSVPSHRTFSRLFSSHLII